LKKRGSHYWIPDDLVELFSAENYQLTKEWLIHEWRLLNRWTHLIEVLETGMPFWEREKNAIHRNHTNFIKSMAHREKENLSSMLEAVSLEGCHHLLDLGGGPGLFAIALIEKHPQLKATIFDTPETQPIARDFIQASKAKSRIKFQPGDFLIDEIGDGYDVALLSSILHIYDEEQNEKLINKVFDALNTPGKIIVRDFFLNPNKTGPLVGALFAVNMLINTQGGNAYTYGEMKKWLTSAGFHKLRKIKLEGRREIIEAEKI
jgi:cyclopropane fatty-acyl-phospholipid synthase-like methyltransferase